MKPHHFKIAAAIFGIALANICCADKVPEIVLGTEPTHGPKKKIVIQLLSPLEEHGHGVGGSFSEDGNDVGIERVSAGDHGFLYTSEGELFIDNRYAGKFHASDTLHFGYNRLWANGVPCFFSKVSKRQASIIYDEDPIGGVQADGSCQVSQVPYRIFLKPVSGRGGSSESEGVHLIKDGMYVLRIEGGVLYANGISFGTVNRGDEIRIIDGRVSVNGAVCLPKADRIQKEIEQAGTGQPATRPESKPEGSDKPQPESEGRSR